MNKQLTIVIVTYNSEQVIKNCLSQIDFNLYDVIVVDNASLDSTLQIVEESFSKVKIIKLDKNLGYGNGNNAGLKQVKTDFALVLNPDANISNNAIEKILEVMKSDEKIALAAPQNLKDNSLNEEELKNKLKKIEDDFVNKNQGNFIKEGDNFVVKFLVGAVVFMRMSIFRQIGFYDKNIFLYYEDDEICKRVIDNSYKNVLVPSVAAFHIPGTSSKPTLRMTYKKGWHLKGWSKLYWRQINNGAFSTKIYAARLVPFLLFKVLTSILRLNLNKILSYLGALSGSFSFLIGLRAFDKKGNPRG